MSNSIIRETKSWKLRENETRTVYKGGNTAHYRLENIGDGQILITKPTITGNHLNNSEFIDISSTEIVIRNPEKIEALINVSILTID